MEILKGSLVAFISKYYRNGGCVFWPDLSTAHYAKKVKNYWKNLNTPVIPKDMYLTYMPKAGPIKDFRANLKTEVYSRDWKATTLKE